MTRDDVLKRLEELEAKATKAPWVCGTISVSYIWRVKPACWDHLKSHPPIQPKTNKCEECKLGHHLVSSKDTEDGTRTDHTHIYPCELAIASISDGVDVVSAEMVDYDICELKAKQDDIELTVAARNHLPSLLTLIRAQQAEIEAWRELWDGEISEPTSDKVERANTATDSAWKAVGA
jgi:hypothetical protein